MRISEVTPNVIADYIHEDSNDATVIVQLNMMRSAAIAFMRSYTGQNSEYIDEHEEFTPVLLALVADMYDTRSYRVDNDKINPFAESVLDMHRINLL